jgi:Fe2+ or Zn2+ uptake regulation protein
MDALRTLNLPSTNEVVREVNRAGAHAGRPSVSRALRVLQLEGIVENVGDISDAWRLA